MFPILADVYLLQLIGRRCSEAWPLVSVLLPGLLIAWQHARVSRIDLTGAL